MLRSPSYANVFIEISVTVQLEIFNYVSATVHKSTRAGGHVSENLQLFII